jgi:phosphoribosylformylglycinamidine cyclo-ligase
VEIRRGSWTVPPIFRLIREKGGIGDDEMFRTFNMGVGMVLAVAPGDAVRTVALFAKLGLKAWVIGDIRKGSGLSI